MDSSSGLPVLQRSTFSFVDLAGSEKWRSSLTQVSRQAVHGILICCRYDSDAVAGRRVYPSLSVH